MVKIPKDIGKAMDITGGLPRIAELFEARNPWNPAIVTEIDAEAEFKKIFTTHPLINLGYLHDV